MSVASYISYFRSLAVAHNQIQHDAATEAGGGNANRKRFTTMGPNEIVLGLRNQVVFPALLIELYEHHMSSEMIYDIRKNTEGAFMVLANYTLNDMKSMEQAYQLTEAITEELLQKIWDDHYGPSKVECGTPFKSFDFSKLEMIPTGHLFQNQCGYHVSFKFQLHNTRNIAQSPAPGTFV